MDTILELVHIRLMESLVTPVSLPLTKWRRILQQSHLAEPGLLSLTFISWVANELKIIYHRKELSRRRTPEEN
jgi:hypothetical protein